MTTIVTNYKWIEVRQAEERQAAAELNLEVRRAEEKYAKEQQAAAEARRDEAYARRDESYEAMLRRTVLSFVIIFS